MTPAQDEQWRRNMELAVGASLDAAKYAARGLCDEAMEHYETGSKHVLTAVGIRTDARDEERTRMVAAAETARIEFEQHEDRRKTAPKL